MNKKQATVLLSCIVIVAFLLRLYFAFQTPFFSDDTSYFHLRHIQHIQEFGYPLFSDPLSFGGRMFIFTPLYHYVMASLTAFGSAWYVAKIVPNLCATALIVIVYFLIKEITKSRQIAVFTACIAAFIPIYFVETVNALSIKAISIPLSCLFLLCFYKVQQQKYTKASIFLMCFLIILDPTTSIILAGLIAYLFLLKISYRKARKEEKEVIFFALLFALWYYLLLYKSALLELGINILWQNIPTQFVDKYYHNITVISSIYHIGLVPLIFGLLVIYLTVTRKQTTNNTTKYAMGEDYVRGAFPIIGILFVTTFLLWTKTIEFTVGLMYASVFLVILSGLGYMEFHRYLQKTKFRGWSGVAFVCVFILLIISSVVPTIYYSQERIDITITTQEVTFLRFLPQIIEEDVTILSLVDDGHYIEFFSGKKTVADTNFMQIGDAKQRARDINTIFNTQSKIVATKIMNRYNATFIYVSPTAKRLYDIEFLPYEDNDCFTLLYAGDVRFYESRCQSK